MLRGSLTHPELLAALAASGHGTRVLVADGNYPFTTGAPATARRVFLNLRRGLVNVPDVVSAIVASVPIEAAEVMVPDDGSRPEAHDAIAALLPDLVLIQHERFAFYERARERDVGVVVATGEARVYANVLLTLGVLEG